MSATDLQSSETSFRERPGKLSGESLVGHMIHVIQGRPTNQLRHDHEFNKLCSVDSNEALSESAVIWSLVHETGLPLSTNPA